MRMLPALIALVAATAGSADQLAAVADAELLAARGSGELQASAGVFRIGVTRAGDRPEGVQLSLPVRERLAAGDRLKLTYRVRSDQTHPMRVLIERRVPPYDAVLRAQDAATPDWQTRERSVVLDEDWPAGALALRFQVGLETGTVEIAGVRLEPDGRDTSPDELRAALQPAAVTERIRRHRMAALAIVLRDAGGKPVANARLEIEQQRHAFLFGCNLFGLQPSNNAPDQLAYRAQFTNLFNYATLPFYWGTYEPQPGETGHERVLAMARWCHERGIATKGHPLVWHIVYPRWAPVEPDAARQALQGRVNDLLPRFAGLIDAWDVVNEANSAIHHADTGTGAWIRRDGPAAAVAESLRWARAARGRDAARLLYNDFDLSQANLDLLDDLRRRDALPDAIGLQSHLHGGTMSFERVWRTAERFSAFGKPVHFTEVTVVSGGNRPYQEASNSAPGSWPTTPEGEAAQASYVARFYELLFSHPRVEAITWWDFSDRRAWMNAPAGLLRDDMTPKPACDRLVELVKRTWWTREQGATTADGRYETRVFRGTHRIRATLPDGRTVETTVTIPWDRESASVEL